MDTNIKRDPQTEEVWRSYLTTGKASEGIKRPWYESGVMRSVARRLPSAPRCQLCYYPFSGLGGKIVRSLFRIEPSKLNPHMCNICERFAEENPGGTEMEMSLMFADIRGSTPLAATMNAYEYSRIINRFYQATTDIIFEHGGMVATLVGDGVVAFFVPAFADAHNYARAAVRAGQEILRATGHDSAAGPWASVGVGVHTGIAYVGAVGEPGKSVDIVVLGDSVNVASRLSDQAQAGEMVISADTVRRGELDTTGQEFWTLTLKGKEEPIGAWIYRAGTS